MGCMNADRLPDMESGSRQPRVGGEDRLQIIFAPMSLLLLPLVRSLVSSSAFPWGPPGPYLLSELGSRES